MKELEIFVITLSKHYILIYRSIYLYHLSSLAFKAFLRPEGFEKFESRLLLLLLGCSW